MTRPRDPADPASPSRLAPDGSVIENAHRPLPPLRVPAHGTAVLEWQTPENAWVKHFLFGSVQGRKHCRVIAIQVQGLPVPGSIHMAPEPFVAGLLPRLKTPIPLTDLTRDVVPAESILGGRKLVLTGNMGPTMRIEIENTGDQDAEIDGGLVIVDIIHPSLLARLPRRTLPERLSPSMTSLPKLP